MSDKPKTFETAWESVAATWFKMASWTPTERSVIPAKEIGKQLYSAAVEAARQEMQAEIDKRDARIKELISLYLDGSPIEDKFQQANYERVLEIQKELNQGSKDE